jgi:hypothetical protein
MGSGSQPPSLPTSPGHSESHATKIVVIVVGSLVVVGALCLGAVIYYVSTSGITRPFDNMFGDQHLKTTISLLELHRLRYGRYPQSLKELKFVGDWDQLALSAVRYYPASDGSKYYVEVARGWVGKPVLEYPPEFWQGTGYSPSLKPRSQ